MLDNRERRVLFPTLLTSFDTQFPMRAELRAEILDREATVPTTARGEKTSWQSDDRLLQWAATGQALGDMISQAVFAAFPDAGADELMVAAWANVLRRGDYFSPHLHGESAWSGTYYLDAGEPDMGGILLLRDPRAGAGQTITPVNRFDTACTFEVTPRDGLLVIFPSWLLHMVTPYRGDRPRISVAFNVR
jgi:uncharacterized protein (TIGR02466 family)